MWWQKRKQCGQKHSRPCSELAHSCLPTFHWPKQVTWPNLPSVGWGNTPTSSGRSCKVTPGGERNGSNHAIYHTCFLSGSPWVGTALRTEAQSYSQPSWPTWCPVPESTRNIYDWKSTRELEAMSESKKKTHIIIRPPFPWRSLTCSLFLEQISFWMAHSKSRGLLTGQGRVGKLKKWPLHSRTPPSSVRNHQKAWAQSCSLNSSSSDEEPGVRSEGPEIFALAGVSPKLFLLLHGPILPVFLKHKYFL